MGGVVVANKTASDRGAPRRPVAESFFPTRNLLGAAVTVGAVGAVAATVEAVAVPALVVGAFFLAPRYFPGLLGRRRAAKAPRKNEPANPSRAAPAAGERGFDWRGLKVGRSLAKTLSYRAAVTGLDFSWNYAILGDVAVSAGLSAVTLVMAPMFYFLHETLWNSRRLEHLALVDARSTPSARIVSVAPKGRFTIDRALAKTITFRTFSSTAELATNYVFVRDFPTAMALSAFGLVIGPFLYFGHEKLWERLDSGQAPKKAPEGQSALIAP